ncbi:MAG: molybdopterin-dependent oxidoreductase [Porticoccaceae bacterium]|nr:molybdopterin-dependent oxidoreductase [Pseudomonadales bacterium]MCP5172318.1 molybdopterin-dependent oxidoreductase [Pseudomonadales bacterium]
MNSESPLPPGQKEHPSYDRFGLGLFANRFPSELSKIEISIAGNVENSVTINDALNNLPRVEQTSDFHCVTTWSVRNLNWSGVRFADFYHQVVVPQAKPQQGNNFVVLRGQDSYAVSMQLEDLLADDVMLADTLNGERLGIDHGAPLRLVAPAHYGYKNAKHINQIEFWTDSSNYRFPMPYPNLMDHPRGRVAYEERACYLPNWLIRPLYKLLQPMARKKHGKMLKAHLAKSSNN